MILISDIFRQENKDMGEQKAGNGKIAFYWAVRTPLGKQKLGCLWKNKL